MTQHELVKCPHCESTSIFIHQEDDLCLCGECVEVWERAAKAQAVPKWVPVSERLPEHKDGLWSDPVIAMTDTGNIYRLSYCGGWQRTSEFMASGSSKVTHWMPLPSAPEQNK